MFAKGAMVRDITTRLHEQQVIKGFKDVDAGLVDGAHHCAACVHSVTHTPHDNGSRPGIQPCTRWLSRHMNDASEIYVFAA